MVDPFTVEIIKNSTIYVAEEMGIVLRNAAYSPNIRDRMDHSCAVLSAEGDLIAQAEHIPVHLGSMAVGVKNTVSYLEKENISLEEGDVIIVNDPYIAGTHLNDILLLKPVHYNGRLLGYVANKAHHVDVGGAVPGSISGDSTEIYQEGIVIPPIKIAEKGVLREDIFKIIRANVRVPRYTIGDIKAQTAALNVGEKRILEIVEKYGVEEVIEAWEKTLEYSENYTRRKIEELPEGNFSAEDYVEAKDALLKIRVEISASKKGLKVDFTGTHPQVQMPLNAVYGVTVAATSYALKAALDPELPMNHGFFRVVEIYAPKRTLVNPEKPAPVAAGNVETSQRIAETVLKALASALPENIPAASHGSMNNVMVGGVENGKPWAFYETIGGGMGGRPGKDGVDGTHVHMTNTMNTPIEVIERECPILFLKYSFRERSGGPGTYRGGLGIVRSFKLLGKQATLSLACERVKLPPWGVKGGLDGERGRHYIIRSGGRVEVLTGKDTVQIREGDVVVLETPGGGGYGPPQLRNPELVLEDVKDGKISLEDAEKYYKVKVVELDGEYKVDWEETRKLRGSRS